MAEVTREIIQDQRQGTAVLGWIALLIAVIALIIAWLAYNRSGQDLETKIQNQINSTLDKTQNGVNQAENSLNKETGQ